MAVFGEQVLKYRTSGWKIDQLRKTFEADTMFINRSEYSSPIGSGYIQGFLVLLVIMTPRDLHIISLVSMGLCGVTLSHF